MDADGQHGRERPIWGGRTQGPSPEEGEGVVCFVRGRGTMAPRRPSCLSAKRDSGPPETIASLPLPQHCLFSPARGGGSDVNRGARRAFVRGSRGLVCGWPVWESVGGMAASWQVRQVESGDGRRLRVEVVGDGDRVILAQLGTPNAGVLFEGWVRDAATRGLSLVTYDRPGYGGSSSQLLAATLDEDDAVMVGAADAAWPRPHPGVWGGALVFMLTG